MLYYWYLIQMPRSINRHLEGFGSNTPRTQPSDSSSNNDIIIETNNKYDM